MTKHGKKVKMLEQNGYVSLSDASSILGKTPGPSLKKFLLSRGVDCIMFFSGGRGLFTFWEKADVEAIAAEKVRRRKPSSQKAKLNVNDRFI